MTKNPSLRQPLNTFFEQNVEPFQKSSIVLSGGIDKPYYYSLGNQSTVPFIRLQGSGGTSKEFTWGETIEVWPGQNVQVESASYMPGDIQVQSGRDIVNRPARITIPVKVIATRDPYGNIIGPNPIKPVFPCDCRGAIRAYLGAYIITNNYGAGLNITLLGINKQHSWIGDGWPFATAFPPEGKKYVDQYYVPANSEFKHIPLGFGGILQDPNMPMHLPDFVLWYMVPVDPQYEVPPIIGDVFFYTLEY